jgi:hypothetical protein
MATPTPTPTQAFVPVKEIKDGVIRLKDGSYRGVLICSSINFGLKSVDEQHAIVVGFQNFLNTLDFSIQIVVHSRKMDLRPYLALLHEKAEAQRTDLMKIQLREYIEFIRSFSEQTNIMTKSFYVVVPFSPHLNASKAASALNPFAHKSEGATPASTFEEERVQMDQRMTLIASGLAGTGVRAAPLGTEEIIELLYRSFNPGELENPIRLDK